MLRRILRKLLKCSHKNAILNSNEGYCPDCGEYVRKAYYIVRCSHCGIKRVSKKTFDKITPSGMYCHNCGSTEYIIEKHEHLNIVDINYAIEIKETQKEFGESEKIEIWVEEPNFQKEETTPNALLLTSEKMKFITG